jgi:hypothetical protein
VQTPIPLPDNQPRSLEYAMGISSFAFTFLVDAANFAAVPFLKQAAALAVEIHNCVEVFFFSFSISAFSPHSNLRVQYPTRIRLTVLQTTHVDSFMQSLLFTLNKNERENQSL